MLEKRLKIFHKYRPIELDYTLDKNEKEKYMKEWARASFGLISKYITEEIVDKSLENANLHLRDGAKDFLKVLSIKKNPVIVMSSGIGNIVESFLKKEECLYNNIVLVSNFFSFDKNIAKIDLNDIMATSNKEYKRISEDIRNSIENKKAGLLFGDLIEDIKMANSIENILTFGFLDENIDENIEEFNKNFDIVLTKNEDFNTVKDILELEVWIHGTKLL